MLYPRRKIVNPKSEIDGLNVVRIIKAVFFHGIIPGIDSGRYIGGEAMNVLKISSDSIYINVYNIIIYNSKNQHGFGLVFYMYNKADNCIKLYWNKLYIMFVKASTPSRSGFRVWCLYFSD